jgi:hypothetical protein
MEPPVSRNGSAESEDEPGAEVVYWRQDQGSNDGDAGTNGRLFTRSVIVGSRLLRTATNS